MNANTIAQHEATLRSIRDAIADSAALAKDLRRELDDATGDGDTARAEEACDLLQEISGAQAHIEQIRARIYRLNPEQRQEVEDLLSVMED